MSFAEENNYCGKFCFRALNLGIRPDTNFKAIAIIFFSDNSQLYFFLNGELKAFSVKFSP